MNASKEYEMLLSDETALLSDINETERMLEKAKTDLAVVKKKLLALDSPGL